MSYSTALGAAFLLKSSVAQYICSTVIRLLEVLSILVYHGTRECPCALEFASLICYVARMVSGIFLAHNYCPKQFLSPAGRWDWGETFPYKQLECSHAGLEVGWLSRQQCGLSSAPGPQGQELRQVCFMYFYRCSFEGNCSFCYLQSFLLKISTGNTSGASSLKLPWVLARWFTEHQVPRPIPHRESGKISQPETLLQSSARRVCSSSLIDPLIINTSSLSSWLCFKQGFLCAARIEREFATELASWRDDLFGKHFTAFNSLPH